MNNRELPGQTALLARISSGDEEAFRQVCVHYRPLLYTIIIRLTNKKWMAEEVVQDVFLKIWLKKAELPEIENFGGWIYRIASNLTLNALKKHIREKQKIDHWLEFAPVGVEITEPQSDQKDTHWEILFEAVDRLPPKQRDTFRLIKEQSMKREEAAKVLKVSPETVKWNLDQALRSIRAYCMTRMDSKSLFIVLLLIS